MQIVTMVALRGFNRQRVHLGKFHTTWTALVVFGYPWYIRLQCSRGHFCPNLGSLWHHANDTFTSLFGSVLHHTGTTMDHGSTSTSMWHHCGIILASWWDRSPSPWVHTCIALEPVWHQFGLHWHRSSVSVQGRRYLVKGHSKGTINKTKVQGTR